MSLHVADYTLNHLNWCHLLHVVFINLIFLGKVWIDEKKSYTVGEELKMNKFKLHCFSGDFQCDDIDKYF